MRDDAVLRRALPLGRGLGRHTVFRMGGHKPPRHTPWVRTHPVSGKAGQKTHDIIPCRIRTQCMMAFSVTGKWVLKGGVMFGVLSQLVKTRLHEQ